MKLILATSIVVAAAVGTVTWLSQRSITEVTETQIAARRQSAEKAMVREAELVVQAVAIASALPAANSSTSDVSSVLEGALADDKKSGDNRVQWLVVRDTAGKTIASTKDAPATLEKLDNLLRDGVKGAGDVVHAKMSATEWVYATQLKLDNQGTMTSIGSLSIGVSTAGLESELAASLDESEARAAASRNRALLISIIVLAIGIVLAALQGIQLAKPIKALTLGAERIGAGDLASRVAEGRRDELGVLAHTFNQMADQINGLLREQAAKVALEREMSLARQVQQAMLPPQRLDQHGSLNVVGYCMPASSCGGDWWTYRKLSNGRMLLVVGDATGHGIHSAMIAATARGAVEALSGIDERLLTPEQVLRAIDSAIREVGEHNVLMTAFAAVFDSTTGSLHYANAGQNFPYVIKLGASRVLEEASIIAASGNPLGDRHIPIEIRRGSLSLRPGDLFVCFTDGVVERANRAGKLFGDRRLRSALIGAPLADAHALEALRDRIIQTLETYADGVMADDDITLVLCQFDPSVSRQSGRGAA